MSESPLHTDPTEAQIRWQVYSSITYGDKGVIYFNYGTRTRHWYQARRINRAIKNAGPTSQVRKVDQKTGRVVPIYDDSPNIEGLQVPLDAGSNRLFLLPKK